MLLSEHVGDCEAPCQPVCPVHMNIPLMNRLIVRGDFAKALPVVKRDIALPAVLGRICPAPCEAGCRRKQVDQPVAICHLKQFVADEDLKQAESWMPQLAPSSGKKVAIIGAGPAGLAAACYLQQKGHQTEVFDQHDEAGGDLLKIEESILPASVLENEIAQIARTGTVIHFNHRIDATEFQQMKEQFDAVWVATGALAAGELFGLKCSKQGIETDKHTYLTSDAKVFAVGNALRPSKLAVRSVGQGKEVAAIIDGFLQTGIAVAPKERFRSKFGKLEIPEFAEYLKESLHRERVSTSLDFSAQEARHEAERCMHCDCRNPESCKLRIYTDEYGAEQRRFQTSERRLVQKQMYRNGIVYEAEKCIKCGICVRLTRQHQEEFGFTFVGRGFDVKIGVPFNEPLQLALQKTAQQVAAYCPTGALAACKLEEQDV
ncbi:MAG: NAD(P)-binding protein [Prolixibacteraceae bacterium]|nr:NAD(P)-binding protein [Prolixibacteraceae bacterium]